MEWFGNVVRYFVTSILEPFSCYISLHEWILFAIRFGAKDSFELDLSQFRFGTRRRCVWLVQAEAAAAEWGGWTLAATGCLENPYEGLKNFFLTEVVIGEHFFRPIESAADQCSWGIWPEVLQLGKSKARSGTAALCEILLGWGKTVGSCQLLLGAFDFSFLHVSFSPYLSHSASVAIPDWGRMNAEQMSWASWSSRAKRRSANLRTWRKNLNAEPWKLPRWRDSGKQKTYCCLLFSDLAMGFHNVSHT